MEQHQLLGNRSEIILGTATNPYTNKTDSIIIENPGNTLPVLVKSRVANNKPSTEYGNTAKEWPIMKRRWEQAKSVSKLNK